MDVSKLTIVSGERNSYSPVEILRWLQEHPQICVGSNVALIASAYCHENGGVENSVRMSIYRLIRKGLLLRAGTKRNSNFRINYLSPEMPRDLLDGANESDVAHIERVKDEIEKALSPKPVESPAEEAEDVEDEKEPESVSEPVSVDISKDGIKISLTINLNLKA